MGCCCCKYIKRKEKGSKQYDILLIGLKGSGKSQIGYWIMKMKNNNNNNSTNNANNINNKLPSTIGVQTFRTKIDNVIMNIIEVGGSDDIRPIWRHYYLKTIACIFVIDTSDPTQISLACTNLFDIMKNRFMQFKPFVVILTKLNENNIDIIDFNNEFDIENISNSLKTPVLLSAIWNDDYQTALNEILLWLKNHIDLQYDNLIKRIKNDLEIDKAIKEHSKWLNDWRHGRKSLKNIRRSLYGKRRHDIFRSVSLRRNKISPQRNNSEQIHMNQIIDRPQSAPSSYRRMNGIHNNNDTSFISREKIINVQSSSSYQIVHTQQQYFNNRIQPLDLLMIQQQQRQPQQNLSARSDCIDHDQSTVQHKNFQVIADVHHDATTNSSTKTTSGYVSATITTKNNNDESDRQSLNQENLLYLHNNMNLTMITDTFDKKNKNNNYYCVKPKSAPTSIRQQQKNDDQRNNN